MDVLMENWRQTLFFSFHTKREVKKPIGNILESDAFQREFYNPPAMFGDTGDPRPK